MKYSSLKDTVCKEYSVKLTGCACENTGTGEAISNEKAAASRNLWYKDGVLQTRKGLSFSENLAIKPIGPELTIDDFRFSDMTVSLGNEQYRLAYAIFGDHETIAEVDTVLIDTQGNMIALDPQYYFRLDGRTFYEPQTVNFYNITNDDGTDDIHMTVFTRSSPTKYGTDSYKLDKFYLRWSVGYTEPYFYAPIVLMNGRGDAYLQAVALDEIERFTPYNPESVSLFTGWCRSYFTSDGHSYRFKTPCESFSDEYPVYVTYYTLEGLRTWEIPAGVSYKEVTIEGKTVRINCNRSYGSISFVKSGEGYAVPRYYECANNIIVKAVATETVKQTDKVTSSKECLYYNRRMLLCKNDFELNEICCMDLRKPFYAPLNACIKLGDNGSPVTALREISGKVFAFKENEIYTVSVEYGKEAKYHIYPIKLNETLYYSDTLSAKLVSVNRGCDIPDTLKVKGDKAIWLNKDRHIYSVTAACKTETVADLTQVLKDIPYEALIKASAFIYDDYYMLLLKDKMFLLNIDKKDMFFWDISDTANVFAACNLGGKPMLAASTPELNCAYFSRMSEEKDMRARYYAQSHLSYICTKTPKAIKSFLKSKRYDFESPTTRKSFESIIMKVASSGGFYICFDGKTRRFLPKKVEGFTPVRLLPHLKNDCGIEFTIESENALKIGDIRFNYRTVDNKF